MIGFAVYFDQLGFKISAYLLKNHLHRDKVYLFKNSLPVFSHKDQMNMNIRNTMSSSS